MMHPAALEWCNRFADPGRNGLALDIGGLNVNGTCRPLWPHMTWTVLDRCPFDPSSSEGWDYEVYGERWLYGEDATTWEPDQLYDLVTCTETLEHVEGWRHIIDALSRALKPDGFAVVTCAGPGRKPHGQHGAERPAADEWYRNIAPRQLIAAFHVLGLHAWVSQLGPDLRAVAAWKPEFLPRPHAHLVERERLVLIPGPSHPMV